jgi:DNA-binding CsgD family transcriptional regulator
MPTQGESPWPRPPQLVNRHGERTVLDGLVTALGAGQSRSLVLHGDPGIGKTALLEYLEARAVDCHVVRAAGVQSEMEFAFGGIHQLCSGMLDRLDALPPPQADALRTAFGLSGGPTPDRFLLGLAILSLLSEAAQSQPLLCLIDDFHWLDYASALLLAFAARRLGAESVGLVFAVRHIGDQLDGLPSLLIQGLHPADARSLLDSVLPTAVDARIRDQIVAETQGNPLALLELPRGLSPAELAVGFQLPGSVALSGTIGDSFERRIDALPKDIRWLLLLAAAEPTGDPILVWKAAEPLGVKPEAARSAEEAGIVSFESRVRFRHPLARSAVYESATAEERRKAHALLAEVTDPNLDSERRTWHLAQAAAGPSEEIATELERSAKLAKQRGCVAAASIYLQKAVALSLDPAQRVDRAIAAAQGAIQSGALGTVAELLAAAETGPLTELQRAGVDLARAQLASVVNRGNEAPLLLKRAAGRLEAIDPDLARDTYLDALSAAIFAGRLAFPGGGVLDVAAAARNAPAPRRTPGPSDLLLDGLVASYNAGYREAVPMLHEALQGFEEGNPAWDDMHWMWLASITAMRVWDDERWNSLSARHVQLARETGSLSDLPLALTSRTYALLFAGDFGAAAEFTEETLAIREAIGSDLAPYGAFALAAMRGQADEADALIKTTLDDVTRRGEGAGISLAEWANALLNNSLGRYNYALDAGIRATEYEPDLGTLIWPVVELIEAAARSGDHETARTWFLRLAEMTSASGTNWALGLEYRCRALVSEDDDCESYFTEGIVRLGRTRQRLDLARTHLLYGEWLRRQRRRTDSREQLRTAHRMFEAIGADAFAERARRELKATGETMLRRSTSNVDSELTAQEAQIARMARDGLSNPEIAGRLFISPHTVQYHLRKVFAKLGISSRNQLDRLLPRENG